ncbi:response regulator transcription factor [Terribacillus halophilus]|uniref:response regulator transcription factor n=1 Tax=Terribacillus halophilus TaxID=361279 RepID=UPI00117D99D3|nr:response regulator transcription factor [Terribacillus halophilus]
MIASVLVVEDDFYINKMVQESLTKEGFDVTAVYDGEEALVNCRNHQYDVILLDLMLPKIDGIECLTRIRSRSMVPVLIMSAKGEDTDKVIGLGLGADDYISKPFSIAELTARVKATLRREQHYMRTTEKKAQYLRIGDLLVDIDNYSIRKFGQEISLTAKEFSILKLFVQHPSNVYTKAQLYHLIWKEDYHGDENVINVHIRRLREKIEDDPSNPRYIKTLWGIGYKLGEI